MKQFLKKMFSHNNFKGYYYILILLLAVSTGCQTISGVYVPASSQIKGNYIAKDYIDGNLKIEDVQLINNQIIISFNNKKTLYITTMYGTNFSIIYKLRKGENTSHQINYRSHLWKDKYKIIIHEICRDSAGKIFYVKFSTEFNLKDCEKSLLKIKLSNLHVQSDFTGFNNNPNTSTGSGSGGLSGILGKTTTGK